MIEYASTSQEHCVDTMKCEIVERHSEIGLEIKGLSSKGPLYVDSSVEKFLRTIPVSSKVFSCILLIMSFKQGLANRLHFNCICYEI